MEPEFLDRAKRGDHKSLKMLTQHFRACARADGSKPEPADTFTVAEVGDRGMGRFDVTKSSLQTISEAIATFTRPPSAEDGTSLAVRQGEALVRICEVALARGTDAPGARPVVSYLTHAHTSGDVTHPLTLGLFSGVIDPRERDRILCDATIVPVTTNHRGELEAAGRASPCGAGPSAAPSPTAARIVDGPVVRSPPTGATSTMSCIGNTADPPSPPTANTSVEDITSSSTNTPTGRSPSTSNSSACTDPTAPNSTPTPGPNCTHPPCTGPSDAPDALRSLTRWCTTSWRGS